MPKEKLVILFSGVPGSSKTPISHYLSWNFNLPIFNNDTMRTEVIEDHGVFDEEKYLVIRGERLKKVLAKGMNFIYDASIDRVWDELKPKLKENGYEFFLINIELEKEFVRILYKNKGYTWGLEFIDQLFNEHQQLIERHSADINFKILQKDFNNRLELAKQAVGKLLAK